MWQVGCVACVLTYIETLIVNIFVSKMSLVVIWSKFTIFKSEYQIPIPVMSVTYTQYLAHIEAWATPDMFNKSGQFTFSLNPNNAS